jgi:hypothetical protein
MVARACNYLYENVSNMADVTVWVGVPSTAFGAITAYVITGFSATAVGAGALFGSAAAVMFSTMFLVNMFVRILLGKNSSTAWSAINIAALLAPLGGWAACAAAGFALTALQITALTISTYIGGLLGICCK